MGKITTLTPEEIRELEWTIVNKVDKYGKIVDKRKKPANKKSRLNL